MLLVGVHTIPLVPRFSPPLAEERSTVHRPFLWKSSLACVFSTTCVSAAAWGQAPCGIMTCPVSPRCGVFGVESGRYTSVEEGSFLDSCASRWCNISLLCVDTMSTHHDTLVHGSDTRRAGDIATSLYLVWWTPVCGCHEQPLQRIGEWKWLLAALFMDLLCPHSSLDMCFVGGLTPFFLWGRMCCDVTIGPDCTMWTCAV